MVVTPVGAVSFVLHAHIPYCRRAGRWPHGEEWLFEAMAESYVPLLNALHDLVADGIQPRLTLGLTPVLCEQLADEEMKRKFEAYLNERADAAEGDVRRGGATGGPPREVAARYRDEYRAVALDFRHRYDRDLIAAFRSLADRGVIELAGGMATHCFTPLLARDSSVHAQLRIGKECFQRHFGREPRAIWLPECAYRPGYVDDRAGVCKSGLEEFLEAEGIGHFFSESSAVESPERSADPYQSGGAFLPYRIAESSVAVIARNPFSSALVWSADKGYPGDGAYREFHKRDGTSGLRYWRVTDRGLRLDAKETYDLEMARARVVEHARDYVKTVGAMLRRFRRATGYFGLVSSHFDAELFGHWWYEGVHWLKEVLEAPEFGTTYELTTAGEFLKAYPPARTVSLRESSWGWNGGNATWLNGDTRWLWELLHQAELAMEAAVDSPHPGDHPDRGAVLRQAARELLLMQGSDWPFLISTGSAREYAEDRFNAHLDAFYRLLDALKTGPTREDRIAAEQLEADHNLFPWIDVRCFAEREGRAG
jgi:1,4-alpha-glucan branching enzyme